MIYTGEMILEMGEFKEESHSNLRMKLSREVKKGEYIRLKRNLYLLDRDIPNIALAQSIYGPSYISFDYALSYYGMIPEYAYNVSCATFRKHKDKVFKTDICSFYYSDVPPQVFSEEVICMDYKGYAFYLATMEKALCDKLYKIPPVVNKRDFETLLLDDMRLEVDTLFNLDKAVIRNLNPLYKSRNIAMLERYLDSLEAES
jgi:hypothetical protein